MLSNKSLGIAGVAMLGTVALLGTNAANAAVNLSAGTGGLKFALETLDLTKVVVDTGGNRYYRVLGESDNTYLEAPLGVPGQAKDRYVVTFTLSGMVFGGQGSDGKMSLVKDEIRVKQPDTKTIGGDKKPIVTFGLNRHVVVSRLIGADPGSNSVSYFFTIPEKQFDAANGQPIKDVNGNDLPGQAAKTDIVTLFVDAFAMPGGGTGSVTMTVKNITLGLDVGDAAATSSVSMGGVVRVVAALIESTYSDIAGEDQKSIGVPTSRVEHEYTSFGEDPFFADDPKRLTNSVGGIAVSVVVGTNALRNASKGTALAGHTDIVDDKKSMVTYAGQFSFAKKVFLAGGSDCSGGDVAEDLLMRGADGAVTSSTRLTPQKLSDANEQYLCIMVDGDTVIPETSRYSASVDYKLPAGESTRVFPPTGKNRRLAYIIQNGIRVTFPYITTDSRYNQRIVVANLSGEPVEYSMMFYPEAGVEAESGAGAMGEFAALTTTVLSVARDDVVTITGNRTRTAARLTIKSSSSLISVATTQVNIETGATDTVTYRTTK